MEMQIPQPFDTIKIQQITPHKEPFTKVGEPDYKSNSKIEATVLIEQLIRSNGTPPFLLRIGPGRVLTDNDIALEISILFDSKIEEHKVYAEKIEGSIPDNWDEESISRLNELGYRFPSE